MIELRERNLQLEEEVADANMEELKVKREEL